MASLVFKDFSLRYPGAEQDALSKVNVEFAEQRSGLAGASGAGKSSLFLAATGLAVPLRHARLSGQVCYGRAELVRYRPQTIAEYIGIVVQDPTSQILGRTVAEDVAFGPRNRCEPISEVHRRVGQALHRVGLSGFEKRRTNELSGGEQQRLVLAGVLAMNPELILFDEASAQLDPAGAAMLTRVIGELADQGVATIVASHDGQELAEQADKVAVLDQGRIVWQGSGADLPANPLRAREWGIRVPALARFFAELGAGESSMPGSIDQAMAYLAQRGIPRRAATSLSLKPSGKPTPGEVVLALRSVSFSYPNGVQAIAGLDLELRTGEMVALMGPNGAGKTTLAKLFNGLLQPSAGQIELAGQPASELASWQIARQVGYVFQNPDHQLFNSSVAKEIGYGLAGQLAGEALKQRISETLAEFHLENHAEENPLALSATLRKRVALASAAACRPRVLVVDEPTAGADYRQRCFIIDRLRRLQLGGTTVVMITHDLDLAAEQASRVVRLEGGRIIADGTPQLVLEYPLANLWQRYFGCPPPAGDPQSCAHLLKQVMLR